jgi:NADPH:quinone reductase-like Zn-dependent oxidoreductase
VPGPGQVLVENHAISLNYGELRNIGGSAPGDVPGWDSAGVVVRAAADGSGPPAGARVVTFGWGGAWGRLRAAETAEVAVVPETVDLGAASALPVAAVTALRAVRDLGGIIGRRILITGASGGVGRFAVQLAARAGAYVIASVGRPERAEGLTGIGAREVVTGLHGVEAPLHGILDNVAGPQLARAFALLAPGATAEWIGTASGQPVPLETPHKMSQGRLNAFFLGDQLGQDLAYLLTLLDNGDLDPQIGWRGGWGQAAAAAEALFARRINGKAVLDLA